MARFAAWTRSRRQARRSGSLAGGCSPTAPASESATGASPARSTDTFRTAPPEPVAPHQVRSRRVRHQRRWLHRHRIGHDSGLTVRADRGTPMTLPANYVANTVQLRYAVTSHRAPRSTVDPVHVVAAPGVTAKSPMSRRRASVRSCSRSAISPSSASAGARSPPTSARAATTRHSPNADQIRDRLPHSARRPDNPPQEWTRWDPGSGTWTWSFPLMNRFAGCETCPLRKHPRGDGAGIAAKPVRPRRGTCRALRG